MLNWAEVISRPVLMTVRLKDEKNPPRPAFAFFNRMKTQKDMEIFPDELSDPDGSLQRKKTIRFISEALLK